MNDEQCINGYNRINQARASIAALKSLVFADGSPGINSATLRVNLDMAIDNLNEAVRQGGFLENKGNADQEALEQQALPTIRALKEKDYGSPGWT